VAVEVSDVNSTEVRRVRFNRAGLHARVRLERFFQRRKKVISATTAIAAMLGGMLTLGAAADAAGDATPPAVSIRGTTKLCNRDEHLVTITRVDVRNNNFRGEPMCLTVWYRKPNFQITYSGLHKPWAAYPNAFVGCEISVCTPHSAMPIQVSNIRQAYSSWHYHPGGPWKGNASYDIWFNPTPMRLGQVNHGAEIMIWLDQSAIGKPFGTPVSIDGTRWGFTHWVVKQRASTWNYIRFWRMNPTHNVTNLNLKSFFGYAEARHLLSSKWWLRSVESGYELWSGGVGMHTLWYSVVVRPWHAPLVTPAPKATPKPTPSPTGTSTDSLTPTPAAS
jgi:hypothetical protein